MILCVVGLSSVIGRAQSPHFETQDDLYARIYNGWKWFHVYCFRCHGVDASGSNITPNLRESIKVIPYPDFVDMVREGRPARGMQSWKALLDNKQITDIFYYVRARSDRVLPLGRPDEVGRGGGEWIPPLEWTDSIKSIDVSGNPADEATTESELVTIGVLLAAPSDRVSDAIPAYRGAVLGVEEANVLAGFFGRRFELSVMGVQGAAEAAEAATRLIERDRAVALISNLNEDAFLAVQSVVREAEVLLLNCSTRAPVG